MIAEQNSSVQFNMFILAIIDPNDKEYWNVAKQRNQTQQQNNMSSRKSPTFVVVVIVVCHHGKCHVVEAVFSVAMQHQHHHGGSLIDMYTIYSDWRMLYLLQYEQW